MTSFDNNIINYQLCLFYSHPKENYRAMGSKIEKPDNFK